MMTLYFKLSDASGDRAGQIVPVTTAAPEVSDTPPSPYLAAGNAAGLMLIDLDTADGKQVFAKLFKDIPLYRISLELMIDKALLAAQKDSDRAAGVRKAFSPDDPPESTTDPISDKYAFEGSLHFPVIANRSNDELLDLYLKLFGPAMPAHKDVHTHLMAILGNHPERLLENFDGFLWRGFGWARLDRLVYDAERIDNDPGITFESYVTRGRSAAQAFAVADPQAQLAAWINAERVQKDLCRDIDNILRLPDIRRLPRWVRADVFRVLEREAMKQVFAEDLVRHFTDWPDLRRARILSEAIEINAKENVSPLVQQILNQTLSADARYEGAAGAFVMQADRRFAEAQRLLK